jgi:hypothetical protein
LTVAVQPLREGELRIGPRHERGTGQRAGHAQPSADVEMRIAGKRRKQVKRGGQRRGTQPAGRSIARKHERIEARLFAQCMAHANPLDEADEVVAAVQEDVLAIVDLAIADFKRRRTAAQQPRALVDFDLVPAFAKLECRTKSRKPRTDDRDSLGAHSPSHARTIAPIFSVRERPARAWSGKDGSRSIFSRMRSYIPAIVRTHAAGRRSM